MNKENYEKVNIEQLIKAEKKLLQFSKMQNEAEETAVIKAFEYCYELSWKALKRALFHEGIETKSPREVFRKSAEKFNIEPQLWFDFLDMRNMTSHTYMDNAISKLSILLPSFKKAFSELIEVLQKNKN